MLELCVFVDGSGIHVPLAPRFRSVLGGKMQNKNLHN